jgi:hypothetical protein
LPFPAAGPEALGADGPSKTSRLSEIRRLFAGINSIVALLPSCYLLRDVKRGGGERGEDINNSNLDFNLKPEHLECMKDTAVMKFLPTDGF